MITLVKLLVGLLAVAGVAIAWGMFVQTFVPGAIALAAIGGGIIGGLGMALILEWVRA